MIVGRISFLLKLMDLLLDDAVAAMFIFCILLFLLHGALNKQSSVTCSNLPVDSKLKRTNCKIRRTVLERMGHSLKGISEMYLISHSAYMVGASVERFQFGVILPLCYVFSVP